MKLAQAARSRNLRNGEFILQSRLFVRCICGKAKDRTSQKHYIVVRLNRHDAPAILTKFGPVPTNLLLAPESQCKYMRNVREVGCLYGLVYGMALFFICRALVKAII